MRKLILIVEDEDTQRQMLQIALQKAGYDTLVAASGREALDLVCGPDPAAIDLVLLDLVLGDIGGIEVLEKMQAHDRDLPVIMLTAHSSIDKAVTAMRAGAIDFIAKPAGVNRLKVSINNALRLHHLSGEVSRLTRKWDGSMGFEDLLGDSPAMRQAIELARKAAGANVPVLLQGESGVGKEVFARAIQGDSDRAGRPFVVVNCGAIPANLVESILFGHEKGAFTGAAEQHDGKFVEADGGTLFLDEIGELPLELQVRLLRVLQEGEVDPVGSRAPVKVDVRLISATNKDLGELAAAGRFREDLYYRLNVFPIILPPLRDRTGDIEMLVPHFIEKFSLSEGLPRKSLSAEALALLRDYPWPGNVRQLENAIFRAVILSEGKDIGPTDFPQLRPLHKAGDPQRTGGTGAADGPEGPEGLDGEGVAIRILDGDGELRLISDIEHDVIRYALDKYDRKMSLVARKLGIGRSTLYRKVAELDLEGEGDTAEIADRD